MTSPTDRLRVIASTPISETLIAEIVADEPRIDFVRDQSLLPPQRFPGDHSGDPAFRRTTDQQSAFDELVDSAQALYGVPDENPAALARTVRANPDLRWVHTMPAGGGAQVKAAGLSDADLARVAFSTSAGVHAQPLAEYAVFGILAGAKTLPRLLDQQRRTEWSGRWAMGLVSQQRILLVGLGSIGQATAAKLKALGATVVGTSRPTIPSRTSTRSCIPTTSSTPSVTWTASWSACPAPSRPRVWSAPKCSPRSSPGSTFVSVGRGTVVDETAMIAALADGRIGFAALDVFATEPLTSTSPLWRDPNVLISPHTAALNSAEDRLIAQLFARNATRFLDGDELLNRVDTVEFY